MGQKELFITNPHYFEAGPLKNPIRCIDHALEKWYPQYYSATYDLRLLAAKSPSEEEKGVRSYNNYRERYGQPHRSAIDEAVAHSEGRHIFLNGFNQKQFDYIAPLLKDTTVLMYLFKCNRIKDLSCLSLFPNLECVLIYGNSTLEALWDMRGNPRLQALSFTYVTKLRHIEALTYSNLEYICFDSMDLSGNKKEMLFDQSVLDRVTTLKHLILEYKEPLPKKAPHNQ